MIDIHRATLTDVEGISAVKTATWPDNSVLQEQVEAAVKDRENMVFVASVGAKIVGYMACFPTLSPSKQLRWEMDELAVAPDYRGNGIARQLVLAASEAGKKRGTVFARALVEVSNKASQMTFAGCGYKTTSTVYGLYSSRAFGLDNPLPEQLHIVPVNCLGYRGAWLEGRLNKEAFWGARGMKRCMLVGAVIPTMAEDTIQAAVDAEFELIGHYHWWLNTL